jgi:hypothetical protein
VLDAAGPIFTVNVNVSAAGQTVLVAGQSSYRMRVLGLMLSSDDAVSVTIESSGGTDLVGPLKMAAGIPFCMPACGFSWGDSVSGEGLAVMLSDAAQVGGVLVYQRIVA